jgi:hypothetical protein
MVTMFKILFFFGFFCFASAVQAVSIDLDTLPEKLAIEARSFLDADTSRARTKMAAFSDEDLQRISTVFKKSHSADDQRIFWLTEELYRRNAERVAAERIRYLYFAVLAAMMIIAGFSAMTYAQTRKARKTEPTLEQMLTSIPEPGLTARKNSSRSTTKKGKRK